MTDTGPQNPSTAETIGGARVLSEFLGVSEAELDRWVAGAGTSRAEVARALADLDFIVARLRLVWGDGRAIRNWLYGANAFLAGARPIDVLRLRGALPVLEAIELEYAGSHA